MYFTVLLLASILNQVVQSQPSDSSEQSQYYGIAEPSNSSEELPYGIAEPEPKIPSYFSEQSTISDSSEELPYGIAKPEPKIIYWSSEDAKVVGATPSSDYLIISKNFSSIWKQSIVHVLYKSLGNNLFTEIDRYVSRFDGRYHKKDWIFELAQYFGRTRGIPRYPEMVAEDISDFYLIPPNATVVSVPYVHPREFNKPRTWSLHSSLSRQAKGLNQIEMLTIQKLVQNLLRERYEYQEESKLYEQMDTYLKAFHKTLDVYKGLLASMRSLIKPLKEFEKKLNDGQLKYKPNEKGIIAMRAMKDMIALGEKYRESLNDLYEKMDELKVKYPLEFEHIDILTYQQEFAQLYWADEALEGGIEEKALDVYERLNSHHRLRDLMKPRVRAMPKYKKEQEVVAELLSRREKSRPKQRLKFISKAFRYGGFCYFILMSAIAALSM